MVHSSIRTPARPAAGGALVPSTVTLALWRLRRTRGLLFVTGLGMIVAVLIVCVVPLYSTVAMTAGLRGVLAANPQNADIVVQSTSEQISARVLGGVTNKLNQEFQQNLGPYLGISHFSIETPVSSVLDNKTLRPTNDQLQSRWICLTIPASTRSRLLRRPRPPCLLIS